MSGSDESRQRRALAVIRAELGMPACSPSGSPLMIAPAGSTAVTLDVDGSEITVWVPDAAKSTYRQKFKEAARRERRRAAEAGNAATTSQLVGGGIGATILAGGVIALVTATSPISIALVAVTLAGAAIGGIGLVAGHWMNRKKYAHEEKADRYEELAEVMK